jgi:transcriptional regulator with XRE-family HTH domain
MSAAHIPSNPKELFATLAHLWIPVDVRRAKSQATDQRPSYGRGTGARHLIDVYVGKRIRIARLLCDMSLETLGNALGLAMQQVQKYESGANRISASRLSATAGILGVPICFFFDGLTPGTVEKTALRERLEQRETIDLVRLYYAIPDTKVREQFLEMVKAMAARKPAADVPLPEAPIRVRDGRRARR